MIHLVAAMSKNRVIGKDNKLIWHLPRDLKMFKIITQNEIVIQGRKTYESIGKPLPNRTNIVLTRQQSYDPHPSVKVTDNMEALIDMGRSLDIYVIGGSEIYKQFLPHADVIHLTYIDHEFEGDSYFPKFEDDFELFYNEKGLKDEKNPYDYFFRKYIKVVD